MELQSEESVFGGGAPGDRVSNGNVPQSEHVQSATRTADGCWCGPAQSSSSALLPPLSGRRTRSH